MKPKNPPKENIHAVILAGGQGTRFWPLSRRDRPKQFLTILGRQSLLQQTVNRLEGLILRRNILIVTYEKQVQAVRKQLPQLERRQILAEPAQRNTAAAIALAAAVLRCTGSERIWPAKENSKPRVGRYPSPRARPGWCRHTCRRAAWFPKVVVNCYAITFRTWKRISSFLSGLMAWMKLRFTRWCTRYET